MSDQLLYSTKKNNPFHHIDIPPRKLFFSRRSNSDMFSDSPKFSPLEETHFRKFLPYNKISSGDVPSTGDGDSDCESNDDPYSSDHFRMFEFKVRRCTRSRSHDWTDCPFAHPGEKARRRDPRRFHYSGTVCPEFRQGGCRRGDNCEFAHGVFECWLHPARYRTEACKDGKNCKRKVCFFAHTPLQLRILPPTGTNSGSGEISPASSEKNFRNLFLNSSNTTNHCCVYCHSITSSPTSTLMGMPHFSPPNSPSPPLSPVSRRCSVSKFSPICENANRLISPQNFDLKKYNGNNNVGLLSYKDDVIELMNSMEAMNVNHNKKKNNNEGGSCSSSIGNKLWVDVVNEDHHNHKQFVLSPTNNNNCCPNYPYGFHKDCSRIEEKFEKQEMNENGLSCPDLGWVNDLLM